MTRAFEKAVLARLSTWVQVSDALTGRAVTTLSAAGLLSGVGQVVVRADEGRILLINVRGKIVLAVQAEGYVSQKVSLDAPAPGDSSLKGIEVRLQPAFGTPLSDSVSWLGGRVLEGVSGRPVANAEVRLAGLPEGARAKFWSTAGGYFLASWPAPVLSNLRRTSLRVALTARGILDGRTLQTARKASVVLLPSSAAGDVKAWSSASLVELALDASDN